MSLEGNLAKLREAQDRLEQAMAILVSTTGAVDLAIVNVYDAGSLAKDAKEEAQEAANLIISAVGQPQSTGFGMDTASLMSTGGATALSQAATTIAKAGAVLVGVRQPLVGAGIQLETANQRVTQLISYLS